MADASNFECGDRGEFVMSLSGVGGTSEGEDSLVGKEEGILPRI